MDDEPQLPGITGGRKRVTRRTAEDRRNAEPTQIGAFLGNVTPLRPTPRQAERVSTLLDHSAATAEPPEAILYQHTVLCQTGMPYRNPGEDVRTWERLNGSTHLKIMAGEAMHPELGRLVEVGLPFGPKPRLILAHLNGEALRQGSPEIKVDDSLTAFVKRLNLDPKGRNIDTIKDQLARLAASSIRLGVVKDGQALTVNSQIVSAFNLWFPKVDGQRVLWPSTVRLSLDYFDSLTRHAVPLHDHALMALSGNAMALDVYAWLAQRLHRVKDPRGDFIPWPALQGQFGWHYARLRDFRRVFTDTCRLVHSQYRGARFDLDGRGMRLWNSPTPVKARTWMVPQLP